MRFLPVLRQALGERILWAKGVPRLEKIEFSRLAKVSKGLTPTYHLARGAFFRHLLYSTIFHTLKQYGALFADLEPVILQWGDYRLPQDRCCRHGLFSVAKRTINGGGALCANREPDSLKPATGNDFPGRRVIYAEHGWLPRSTYQLSSHGCNSRNHIKFSGDRDYIRLIGGYEHLERLKRNLRASFGDSRALGAHYGEQPFFLVALQPKTGNNLDFLTPGAPLARNCQQGRFSAELGQALIDHVESVPSSCRIIFTQHPGDLSQNHYRVCSGNMVVYAGQGPSTIDLVRHGNCRGVIAINSNILHEALLWERPTLALGALQAEPSAESPFSGDLQSFFRAEGVIKSSTELGDQYLAMLCAYQWTLSDLQEPLIVREILRDVDGLVPCVVRREYGSCL
jgi:hypothetical protein